MARAWWLGGLLLLASCSGVVQTYGPDGRESYIIQCRGGRYACVQQAGDLCGKRGYAILDPAGQAMPQGVALGAPELMVSCKDAHPSTVYSGESRPPPPPLPPESASKPESAAQKPSEPAAQNASNASQKPSAPAPDSPAKKPGEP